MVATEQSPPGAQRQFRCLVVLERLDGMVEERVADEVVLGLIVAADEDDRQRPALLRAVPILRARVALIGKIARSGVPTAQMSMELQLGLRCQIGENGLDANLDRFLLRIEIPTAMEVVLVDDRPPV